MTEAQVADSVGKGRVSEGGQRGKLTSATNGGCAKGMPRNQFVLLTTVPMNLPLSRVTIGPDACTTVGAARDVTVAVQMVTSNA